MLTESFLPEARQNAWKNMTGIMTENRYLLIKNPVVM